MSESFSESEQHGLGLISEDMRKILSVGISTGGAAEIEMIRLAPNAQIIATSIDEKGIEHAKGLIAAQGLSSQIEVKHEDVSEPMNYETNSIDYVYARLVLHYLSRTKLDAALQELHRVLKPGGKLYAVVRSTECDAAKQSENVYDEATGMTSFKEKTPDGNPHISTRFFHTVDTISSFVNKYFRITNIVQYDEMLFKDFERTVPANWQDNVIELTAMKGF